MPADRVSQLTVDGYECAATMRVGVAYYSWRVDLDVEFDRELRLVEETVLKLLAAGVSDPEKVAHLMGLNDGRIVPRCFVDLITKGLVALREGNMVLTLRGREAVSKASTREKHTFENVEMRYDPYRDVFLWEFEEPEYRRDRLGSSGLRALPSPSGLREHEVEARYRDVQALVEKEGLPFGKGNGSSKSSDKRICEILRVRPLRSQEVYLEGTLEAWYREQTGEWAWRLLRGDGEEPTISEKLHELEAGGSVIIPLEEKRELTLSAAGQTVHAAVEVVQQHVPPTLLQTLDHRQALQEAITTAQKELIIISPWLRTDAVDQELMGWLYDALDKSKGLRITIGYGIDGDAKKQRDWTVKNQKEALARLHNLSSRSRNRLRIVEIGNTHEKIVICDDRFAIITSFNWLSFNPRPGKGVRRETGTRITVAKEIAHLKTMLAPILKLSGGGG